MERERRRRGWIGTLAALCTLVAVGFLCGALAGFLWEEPRLVVAYLSGETETVDWSELPTAHAEEAAAPEAPAVAAPPPPASAEAKKVAPPSPAPPQAGGFAVQVGAFGERSAAERLAGRLREHGYTTYLRSDASAGGASWRVRVGPVSERDEAVELARRLERDEKLPTWVLEEGEG